MMKWSERPSVRGVGTKVQMNQSTRDTVKSIPSLFWSESLTVLNRGPL
jgi:hypothetical protein